MPFLQDFKFQIIKWIRKLMGGFPTLENLSKNRLPDAKVKRKVVAQKAKT